MKRKYSKYLLTIVMLFCFIIGIETVRADKLMSVKCSNVSYVSASGSGSSFAVDLYFLSVNGEYSGTTFLPVIVYNNAVWSFFPSINTVKRLVDDVGRFPQSWKEAMDSLKDADGNIEGMVETATCPLFVQVDIPILGEQAMFHFAGSMVSGNGQAQYMDGYQLVYYETEDGAIAMEVYTAKGEYGFVVYYPDDASLREVGLIDDLKEYAKEYVEWHHGCYQIPDVIETGPCADSKTKGPDGTTFNDAVAGIRLEDIVKNGKTNGFFDIYDNNHNLIFDLCIIGSECPNYNINKTSVNGSSIMKNKKGDGKYFKLLYDGDDKPSWYNENKNVLASASVEKTEYEKKYKQLIEESKKIVDALDNGRNYSASDATIKALIEAIKENADISVSGSLFSLLASGVDTDLKYTSMDDSCNVSKKTISNAGISAADYLGCKLFNVHSEEVEDIEISFLDDNGVNFEKIINFESIFSGAVARISAGGKFVTEAFYESVFEQVENLLKAKGLDDVSNWDAQKKEYLHLFGKAAIFLKNNYSSFVDDEFKEVIESYKKELRERYEIELVYDCESLLGEALKNKLNEYLKFVKIVVPIILLGFGILDFAKAVFAGDDEQMKKAQKKFLLRVAIAVLFFFVPVIVNLILCLANRVWNSISPNSCI